MSGIGVIVALPRELPAGFVRFDDPPHVGTHHLTVYASTLAATQHVAVQAGVGHIRAAEGARLLIRRFSPQGLLSFGFAGGLAPELTRGTLIIGTEVVCQDWSSQGAVASRDLVEQFHAAAVAEKLQVQRGRLVTSRHIVPDPSSKAELRDKSGACAVDMETAGIAEVAVEAGLPWAAVRAIVDGATDTLSPACIATLREDGHVAIGRLLRTSCRSPRLLWHMLRLARDVATARRHLSQAFERWAKSLVAPWHQRLG